MTGQLQVNNMEHHKYIYKSNIYIQVVLYLMACQKVYKQGRDDTSEGNNSINLHLIMPRLLTLPDSGISLKCTKLLASP